MIKIQNKSLFLYLLQIFFSLKQMGRNNVKFGLQFFVAYQSTYSIINNYLQNGLNRWCNY